MWCWNFWSNPMLRLGDQSKSKEKNYLNSQRSGGRAVKCNSSSQVSPDPCLQWQLWKHHESKWFVHICVACVYRWCIYLAHIHKLFGVSPLVPQVSWNTCFVSSRWPQLWGKNLRFRSCCGNSEAIHKNCHRHLGDLVILVSFSLRMPESKCLIDFHQELSKTSEKILGPLCHFREINNSMYFVQF